MERRPNHTPFLRHNKEDHREPTTVKYYPGGTLLRGGLNKVAEAQEAGKSLLRRARPLRGLRHGPGLAQNKCLKAREHTFTSQNFPTTISTDVPKSSEGETGALRIKFF